MSTTNTILLLLSILTHYQKYIILRILLQPPLIFFSLKDKLKQTHSLKNKFNLNLNQKQIF